MTKKGKIYKKHFSTKLTVIQTVMTFRKLDSSNFLVVSEVLNI